jgi:hypothetical protein
MLVVGCLGALGGCGASRGDGPNRGLVDTNGGGGGLAGSGSGATASTSGSGAGSKGGSGGSGGTGGTGGSITIEDAGAGGACEREVTLQAVVLGEPAPFDLVIVADHSQSLAWSRDELSSGLHDLLTNVQGRAVRVFLLTPTQYGASSASARMPLTGAAVVAWQDPMTMAAYEDAMTTYAQSCTDADGASIACPDARGKVAYKQHGEWSFVMPEPIAMLTSSMTDAEFAAEQNAVADAILAIGGTGSPHEQPLCTLARYVGQEPNQLPENAVFVVISDEDDVSKPDDCLATLDSELKSFKTENGSTPCTSNCDVYRYSMTGHYLWERHPYTCSAYTDTGDLIPGTDMSSYYNYGYRASCDGVTPGPCTDSERAEIQPFCESGLKVSSCTVECASMDYPCRVDLPDASIDACAQAFKFNGTTWPNLPAYCATVGSDWHDCTGGGLTLTYDESFSGTDTLGALVPGADVSALGSYFKAKAAQLFGAGKFLVEGIVFEPGFSCSLGEGQSYATNIGQMIGDSTHLFPLCQSYAPALKGVLDFAQALIQTKFTLNLEDDEHVTAVVVIAKDGSERTLGASQYTFDETTGLLSIQTNVLRGTDANLRVEVTSDCRAIVR